MQNTQQIFIYYSDKINFSLFLKHKIGYNQNYINSHKLIQKLCNSKFI
jgi:hypothetical protein